MASSADDDLRVTRDIQKACSLLRSLRGISATDSVPVLHDHAALTGISVHAAALAVLAEGAPLAEPVRGAESASAPTGPSINEPRDTRRSLPFLAVLRGRRCPSSEGRERRVRPRRPAPEASRPRRHHQVSVGTVVRALGRLKYDGVLVTGPGRRTFVRAR